MHPRIKEVKKILEELNPVEVLSKSTLIYLADKDVSVIEASIAISLTYQIPIKVVDDFIYPDDIFPYLDLQEAFFQSMEYGEGIEDILLHKI